MRRLATVIILTACAAGAQVRTLTLREAVDLALKQSPELAKARIDDRADAAKDRVQIGPRVFRWRPCPLCVTVDSCRLPQPFIRRHVWPKLRRH